MVNATTTTTTTTTPKTLAGVLGLDADLLNACVSCGLCLPHCPTYRATEEESASPRGRITMMRAVESGELAIDDDFTAFMERCVMCRGCETACPSGVQFGALMEQTRVSLADQGKIRVPVFVKLGLRVLEHHRLLSFGSAVLGRVQSFGLIPDKLRRRVGLPESIPVRNKPISIAAGAADVWLFTGCVMDVWQRDVHEATKQILELAGAKNVALPRKGGDCCGALHLHVGQKADGVRLATKVIASMPGNAPIVVNSAGCGAALKDYGHLLGTVEAEAFSKRVYDASEWLAQRLEALPEIPGTSARLVVAVQDPCHLRHVQKAHLATRKVLERFVDVREIADDGRCCGAGGSYSVLQPELAEEIRAQKIAAVQTTGATTIASANPGCSMWLANAPHEHGEPKLRFVHPMKIITEALATKGRSS
jgi:glycolate oxidase iron-sulfur subunit